MDSRFVGTPIVGDETRELGNMTLNGVDRLTRVSLDASPLDDRGDPGARRAPDVVPPAGASGELAPPTVRRVRPRRVVRVRARRARLRRRRVHRWRRRAGRRQRAGVVPGFRGALARRRRDLLGVLPTMTAHLGLPNWQYACTDVGLDPGAAQWYAFLDPERLAVDLERGRLRRSGRTGRARRARNSAGHASRAAAAETKIGDAARANAKKSSSANASTSVAARARASLEGSNDSTRPSSGRKR